MAAMAPMVHDFGKLLEGIPRGAWVAISQDESRVLAYSAEMKDAVLKARELGEENPIIVRVPQSPAAFVF
ncbi:MAG TPA: hypothetical protein VMH28_13740 [Candidatus Acidoferrales bacterium]|nr:hypothetical protein [Candidatus Acidoferrales bacterium]